MGTGPGFADFRAVDLDALLPEWMNPPRGLALDIAGDSDEDEQPGGAQSGTHVLAHALPIPGTLHIVHNMSHDLDLSLAWWPSFHAGFMCICQLLFKKFRREQYVRTCLVGTPICS